VVLQHNTCNTMATLMSYYSLELAYKFVVVVVVGYETKYSVPLKKKNLTWSDL
jgi:hypothetical protein